MTQRSTIGNCCIHSAIMLEMADWPLPEYANRDNVLNANKGQAALLRKAADISDEMLDALKEMVLVYWGDGDGIEPPPACIQIALKAIKRAENGK